VSDEPPEHPRVAAIVRAVGTLGHVWQINRGEIHTRLIARVRSEEGPFTWQSEQESDGDGAPDVGPQDRLAAQRKHAAEPIRRPRDRALGVGRKLDGSDRVRVRGHSGAPLRTRGRPQMEESIEAGGDDFVPVRGNVQRKRGSKRAHVSAQDGEIGRIRENGGRSVVGAGGWGGRRKGKANPRKFRRQSGGCRVKTQERRRRPAWGWPSRVNGGRWI
jgi:hypothetical protein